MKRRTFLSSSVATGVAAAVVAANVPGVAGAEQNQQPAKSNSAPNNLNQANQASQPNQSNNHSNDQSNNHPDKKISEVVTTRAPKPVGPFSQAIKANGFVFLAGQVARDPKTGQVIDGDITAQTERIMENIKAILEAAGSSLDRTVKTTVFLQDMNDFDAMGKVYTRYFPSPQPARSAVQVVRLHGGRIEIELVAVV